MDRRLASDLFYLAALLSSAALFYVVGILPIAFGCLALFIVLSWFRIDLGLLAIIVFLPYFMAPKLVDHHPWPPSEWLMIGVGVAALGIIGASLLGKTRASGEPNDLTHWAMPISPSWRYLRSSPFLLPGLIFFLAAFVTAMDAAVLKLSAYYLLETVVEPIAFFALLLAFTPLDSPAQRERSLLMVGIAVVTAGVAASVIGLGQLVTDQHLVIVKGEAYRRIIGPYQGPDNFGLFLDRTIPIALALLLVPAIFLGTSSDPHRPGGRWMTAHKAAFLGAFLLMGAALVFTFVLGAWLGTAIAAVMLLVMRFRHGWWLVGAATLVLVAGVALGSGHQHRLTGGKRLLIWQSAISMIRDHPILGIGLDNFQHYYTPAHGDGVSPTAHDQSGRCSLGLGYIQKTHDALTEPCISHPHNLVLDLWLSTGIVGLVAFIALQAVFWSILWRARSVLTLSPVLLGAGGAMLAGLIHGMVDNGYFLVDLSALTWLLFAIASMYATSLPQEPTNGRWWNAFGRRGSGDPANRRSDWVRAVDSGPPGTTL